MQRPGRRCFFGFIAGALLYIILCGIILRVRGRRSETQAHENAEWVASGRYWLDRTVCQLFGLCGTLHLNSRGWTWQGARGGRTNPAKDSREWWTSGDEDPDTWTDAERRLREIPQFVFDHAPYVHLFSGEQFWPGDLSDHIQHTTPRINYTIIEGMKHDRNLTNLNELNDVEDGMHGRFLYLQSDDNVEERPEWLGGSTNIPHAPAVKQKLEVNAPWPDLEPVDNDRTRPSEQHSLKKEEQSDSQNRKIVPPINRVPSVNGRCGGNTGYTCKGSAFGQCCSIAGWCGGGHEYCEALCDPLAGTCTDPLDPPLSPKLDLRRHRQRDFTTSHSRPTQLGRSSAPAHLIVIDKGHGIVDAFWFFFYSYNLGNKVFNIRFGNHVGDWEHTLVRFKHGRPYQVFLSEHSFGEAYTWHAIEKYLPNPDGSGTMLSSHLNTTISPLAYRPVVYSAVGTHAMYATPGLHPYILPWGLLHDQTDRGPLWDPSLNVQAYTYNLSTQTLRASTRNPHAPTGWFHYAGHWGDKFYPLSDPRQYRIWGEYHYVNGPTGPKFKNLGREKVCQGRNGECHLRDEVGAPPERPRRVGPATVVEMGEEEGGLPGGNWTGISGL